MIELPELRPYQESLVREVRTALVKHRSVIVCMPPGAGKTRTAKYILGLYLNRQKREGESGKAAFMVHRRGLVENASDSCNEHPQLPHGVIMSGHETSPTCNIQVASIDTKNSWYVEKGGYRSDFTYDFLVFDEIHAHVAKFRTFLEAHSKKREELGLKPAFILGLSATPQHKELNKVFNHIVTGPSPSWLIDNGFLSPFRYFQATQGKLGLLVKKGDEYTEDSVAEAMQGLAGDLVKDWKKLAEGRATVGFFPRRSHAYEAMELLRANGVDAHYVDGETSDEERQSLFKRLNSGEIEYICNVGVIERGTDIPRVGCVQLCTAIGSVVRYRQMVGRGSRVHPDVPDCIVLDHANSIKKHGFFEDDIAWTLEWGERPAKTHEPRATVTCPSCCVSRGTMILTDRGEVPIQDVRASDLVWDGIDFCSHEGACCNGIKEAIEWRGLILTPDHKVLTDDGWKEAEEAKSHNWKPVIGGFSGSPIRTTDDSNPYYSETGCKHGSRSGLFVMWKKGVETLLQDITQTAARMRTLYGEIWSRLPFVACAKSQSGVDSLQISKSRSLHELRWSWDRVSFFFGARRSAMDSSQHWLAAKQVVDVGPNRQQWALRTWKFKVGDHSDASRKSQRVLASAISKEISIREVFYRAANQSPEKRIVSKTDCGAMVAKAGFFQMASKSGNEGSSQAVLPLCAIQQTPRLKDDTSWHESRADSQSVAVEVWDIRNAGPRNRYCANGIIVSNCAMYRGGKCRNCGYEPTPSDRKSQGLTFTGGELKEIKKSSQKEKKKLTNEQIMLAALYKAGFSGKTWGQAWYIAKRMAEQQGTDFRVPATVEVAGSRYKMIPYGHPDCKRKVRDTYGFTIKNFGREANPYRISQ